MASSANLTDDELEDTVLNYLRAVNRPYNVADITLNLHNIGTKSRIVKALALLESKGYVITKTYNKTSIHCLNQSTIDSAQNEKEIQTLQEEKKALTEQLARLEAELSDIRKAMTIKQLKEAIGKLETEISDDQELIDSYNAAEDGVVDVSEEDIEAVRVELNQLKQKNKSLKILATDLYNCVQDNLSDLLGLEDKSELDEYLGLEWPNT